MKYLKTLKTKFQSTTVSDCYSVDTLRRLLRALPSWKQWPLLLANQHSLVECLRLIAEVVIWGDQHEPEIFAVFQKEDGLHKLMRVLRWKANRRGPVAVQMLQTFAMLIQNIQDKRTMTYLLNHHAIGQIISLDFDFSDEDVLGYYVSFVKSISFRLNESTVGSFTKRVSPKLNTFSMPLFSASSKFIGSPERMVRSAARTLTLTIMSLKNEVVDRFLVSDENRGFFKTQISNLSKKIHELNELKYISEPEKRTKIEVNRLTAEIEDDVCYLNDIYTSGSKVVQIELANAVWDEMLGQHLTRPLFAVMDNQLSKATHARSVSGAGHPFPELPRLETLMKIAREWIPLKETDFHRTIFTTFIASTMNVLLRGPGFVNSHVIMQLINQAFHELDKSAQRRLTPLVDVDLEMLDLTEDLRSKSEAAITHSKMRTDSCPAIGLLEFADRVGLDVCSDKLSALFHKTKCEKYKPSPLIKLLVKNPESKLSWWQFVRSALPVAASIRKPSSKITGHQRLSALTHISPLRRREDLTALI